MTEKYFSLVNVKVIFNIIFFDYVKELTDSVISSLDTVGEGGVFIRGGRLNKGAFIDGFYLSGRRSFEGAFIQSIRVIRTCFSF